MADVVFTEFKRRLGATTGGIRLDNTDANEFGVLLAMTNATLDTAGQEDVTTLSGLTLDEYDGSGYSRQALGSVTYTNDDANDRGEWDAADSVFSTLGAGTRSADFILVFWSSTNTITSGADASNVPIVAIDVADFAGNGGDVTISWDVQGILQVT